LAELIEVQASNDADLLIHVTLSMEVLTETRTDKRQFLQPVNFLWLKLVLSIDNPHVDLHSILVLKELPGVDVNKRLGCYAC
jgi:hypothetical protein